MYSSRSIICCRRRAGGGRECGARDEVCKLSQRAPGKHTWSASISTVFMDSLRPHSLKHASRLRARERGGVKIRARVTEQRFFLGGCQAQLQLASAVPGAKEVHHHDRVLALAAVVAAAPMARARAGVSRGLRSFGAPGVRSGVQHRTAQRECRGRP